MRSWNGYNIAIPVIDFKKKGYSAELRAAFKIDNPILDGNEIKNKDREKIENCFKRISGFNYGHAKLADWYVEIFRNIMHIHELINSIKDISSSTLISYVEMLLESLHYFKKKYNDIDTFLKKCREDALYQQRYETEYEEIRQINADFIAVSELIDKYYRHIERGYI